MPSSTSSSDPAAWCRFFRLTAGTVAVVIGVIWVFVVLVDPWDVLPLSPPLDRVPVTASQRFAYPSLARSERFDSAVFGTSTSRLLRPSLLNPLFQARFANLAMNDATPWEQTQLMQVFLRAHPNPKRIVLGIDLKWCEPADAIPRLTQRPFPEWMYARTTWSGYHEMLNMYAIQEAGKEFGVLTGLKRQEQGSDGYTVFVPPDDRYDRARALMHIRADAGAYRSGAPEGSPSAWRFGGFDDLRPLLARAPAETQTILFFVPYNHVLRARQGDPVVAVWAECKARAVALARALHGTMVVDFMKPGPITDDDDNYWDSQHVRVEVADRVARDLAAAARGERSDDYDILLLP